MPAPRTLPFFSWLGSPRLSGALAATSLTALCGGDVHLPRAQVALVASPPPTSCGAGTVLNATSGQCDIECDSGNAGRRLDESVAEEDGDAAAWRETILALVRQKIAALPKLRAADQELVAQIEQAGLELATQLFGLPALA